jgi:hypothetical protein
MYFGIPYSMKRFFAEEEGTKTKEGFLYVETIVLADTLKDNFKRPI